ncbi:MAG: GNAT family N-acetyltransferase [Chloroflexota bacterium]|nr:GNAT family N-acetyltransferase [Chloroflexota bacterium]
MPTLVPPAVVYRDSYLAAAREFAAEGRYRQADLAQLRADFPGFVALLRGQQEVAQVSPGRVAETVLWLVEGRDYIGRVSIRHTLNEWLRHIGGHIGYEIRPSRRHRGYGTLILRLALPYARDLGLPRVLITCDADNVGSRRIIEANGGQFENSVLEPDRNVRKLRYWIDLAAPPPDHEAA